MDGCENRDCIIYDGKRVGLSLHKPKEYYLKRALAVAITTLTLMLVGAVAGIAILRGDILQALNDRPQNGGSVDVGNGNVSLDDGKHEDADVPSESEKEEGAEDSESSENQAGGTDQPPEDQTAETVTKDLSASERGDAYIINYSSLNPDAKGLLEMGFGSGRYTYSEEPVVLILHTHTSETYADADKSDPMHPITRSVLTVGERIAYKLSSRGVPAVHCTVIHDGDGEDPYASAADTIATMLKIYPSVKYVIDLHRAEELDGDGKPVRSVSAIDSAQIRVTVSIGGARTGETLALALCLRRELNSDGRKLSMPVVLTDSKYNAHMSRYYLKVDVGTQANSTDESVKAGEAFAEALAEILKK